MEIEDVTPASIANAKEAQMRERIAAGVDQEGRSKVDLAPRMVEAFKFIADLSAGWDADGSLGPKPPLSWETVARISLDVARSMVAQSEGK